MPGRDDTVQVLITSIDGRVTHQFQLNDTVNAVRQFGYENLVQDKGQIPLDSTWIEQNGIRLDNSTKLSSLIGPKKNEHEDKDEPRLTLNLAWTQQGGSSVEIVNA